MFKASVDPADHRGLFKPSMFLFLFLHPFCEPPNKDEYDMCANLKPFFSC